MKKFIITLIMLSLLCTGCQNSGRDTVSTTDPAEMTSALADPVTYEPDDFEISAQVYQGEFARGESIWINVSITNKMDVAYTWTGSSSYIQARTKFVCTENGREFIIHDDGLILNDDDNYNEFKPGETETTLKLYEIPEDAAPGEYTLVCSFKNTTFEMKGGFILEEEVTTHDSLEPAPEWALE